jgi:hypothetical protein
MLVGRQISYFTIGIWVALTVPSFSKLLEQPNQIPGPILIAGAVIGAIGIYLGSGIASTYYKMLGRILRLAVWGFLGLGMSISTVYFGLRAQDWWYKLIFFGAGCLPLFAHLAALFQVWRRGILTRKWG